MIENAPFSYEDDATVPIEDYQTLLEKYHALEADHEEEVTALKGEVARITSFMTLILVDSHKALLKVDRTKKTIKSVQDRNKVLDQIKDPITRAKHIADYVTATTEQITTVAINAAKVVEGRDAKPEPGYSLLTRTQERAKALADYMKETNKASLKTSEAKAYLEGLEGQRLWSMQVIRAMRQIPSTLGAVFDHIGGRRERRLRLDSECAPQPKNNGLLRSWGRGPPEMV